MNKLSIHKEGRRFLVTVFLMLMLLNLSITYLIPVHKALQFFVTSLSIILFLGVSFFFRNPRRFTVVDTSKVIAPADGRVVVVEEVEESEYFNDKRLQVSIFMSPTNVHVNRNPVSGQVKYTKYHEGKYLVAWHPKSSEKNERNTIVIGNNDSEVMIRQIAGALARRIVSYLNVGDNVVQGTELGFIKFGSRVDIFLPLDADVKVNMHDKVKGGESVIASLK